MAISHPSQLRRTSQPTQLGVVLNRRRTLAAAGAPVTTQMAGNRPSSKYATGMVTLFSPKVA
jgi:hypothetical protein